MTVRKTLRHGLGRVRDFWQTHGVWPDATPQSNGLELAYQPPSPGDIESAACTLCGGNVWTRERGPYIAEYDTGDICGYCSYECYFTHRHRNRLAEVAGEQSVYVPPA